MRVASYNVKCFNYNKDLDPILEVLRAVSPDVVGLQELDWNTTRSGPENQLQKAAEALGYPYWYFAKAIDHRGGAYGHGILSRYPILSAETVNYEVIGAHDHDGNRCYARAVLEVAGKELVFYNTHLTLDQAGRAAELEQVLGRMKKEPCAVLTGDLNAESEEVAPHAGGNGLVMLNPGIPTFPQGNASVKSIDHIIVTSAIIHGEKITVYPADCSDHNLIYVEIEV